MLRLTLAQGYILTVSTFRMCTEHIEGFRFMSQSEQMTHLVSYPGALKIHYLAGERALVFRSWPCAISTPLSFL